MKSNKVSLFFLLISALCLSSCSGEKVSSSLSTIPFSSSSYASASDHSSPQVDSSWKDSASASEENSSQEPDYPHAQGDWTEEEKNILSRYLFGEIPPFFDYGDYALDNIPLRSTVYFRFSEQVSVERREEALCYFDRLGWFCENNLSKSSPNIFLRSPNLNLQLTVYDYQLMCHATGVYAPESQSQWPEEVMNQLNVLYPGKEIPFIYLCTDYYETVLLYEGSNRQCLRIVGGVYTTDLIFEIQTMMERDHPDWQVRFSYSDDILTGRWEESGCLPSLVCSKDFEDGTYLRLELGSDSYTSERFLTLRIYSGETYDSSDSTSSWNSAVSSELSNYLGSHTLPYLNLGRSEPNLTELDSGSSFKSLLLEGGRCSETMLSDASDSLIASGWNASYGKGCYGKSLFAYHEFDDEFVIYLELGQDENGFAFLKVFRNAPDSYYVPSRSSWPSEIDEKIKANDGNHEIPYLDLHTSSPTWKEKTTDQDALISGGLLNYCILLDCQKTLEENGYQISFLDRNPKSEPCPLSLIAEKEMDGDVVQVILEAGHAMKVYVRSGSIPSTGGEWSFGEQYEISLFQSKAEIPYLDLNAPISAISIVDSYSNELGFDDYPCSYLQLLGGDFDVDCFESDLARMNQAGWRVCLDRSGKKNVNGFGFSSSLTAFHTQADGALEILRLGMDKSGKFLCRYNSIDSLTTDHSAYDWNPKMENLLESYFPGATIPYLYLGVENPLKKSFYQSRLCIAGGFYRESILQDNFNALTLAGWSVQFCDFTMLRNCWGNSFNALIADKQFDGDQIRIEISYTYSNEMTAFVYYY